MTDEELQLILEEGEGYTTEFKRNTSNLDKEMVAFANASGGRIFVGIDDDGSIPGIEITNKLKSDIQNIARQCDPPVKILFEEFKNILIVKVYPGSEKPYRCSSGFYMRVGPNSQKMRTNEIREFFQNEGKIRFDELINEKFNFENHFDENKLERFLKIAGISKALDTASILTNLGVAEKQGGKVLLNNAGVLFFSRKLSDIYYHTVVTCARYKGTNKAYIIDKKDFNEDLVSSVDNAMNFLKQYIPLRYEFTGEPQRKEIPEIPYEALREAVINAITHRNYFEKGANVFVEVFDDRIEISNPGGLPKGLDPKDFGKKSVLRNPIIASLFHRINYIEKMGTGISRIQEHMKNAGLQPVEFQFNTFFTAIFRRLNRAGKEEYTPSLYTEKFSVKFSIKFSVKGKRLERLLKILDYLLNDKLINAVSLSNEFGVSIRMIYKDIKILENVGWVVFEGSPKTGSYVITQKGKKEIEEMKKEN